MTANPGIERLDEDGLQRVLCVVAHPDDMEYGMSAAVHHWTANGVEVAYLLLTAGEAGMKRPPAEVGPLRHAEQRAACDIVGARHLTILDHPDGLLEPTLAVRRDIAREIRRIRPEAVVTMNFDLDVPWGLNHADHRATGIATADACRDADNPWLFTELLDEEGLEPWGPEWLLVGGASTPTHGVAVAQADVDAAVASLEAHEAYLADLPDHPAPNVFIPETLRAGGEALGTDHAVLFRAYRLR